MRSPHEHDARAWELARWNRKGSYSRGGLARPPYSPIVAQRPCRPPPSRSIVAASVATVALAVVAAFVAEAVGASALWMIPFWLAVLSVPACAWWDMRKGR